MPTPFYHLKLAEEILAQGAVQSTSTDALLSKQRAAFLLGNTAPDVQVVSGQPREATHFYTFPMRLNKRPPWEVLLAVHPELAHPEEMPPAQAAFIAGYLCHLQADYFWSTDIFVPTFGRRSDWESFPRRLYLHNVLRAYLDREILPDLGNGVRSSLSRAAPQGWLPFVEDAYLYQWRDYLSAQLTPGAKIETVEVFAARQGISPEEYYHLLGSPERMEQEIFTHLPYQRLEGYHQHLLDENFSLLEHFSSR